MEEILQLAGNGHEVWLEAKPRPRSEAIEHCSRAVLVGEQRARLILLDPWITGQV